MKKDKTKKEKRSCSILIILTQGLPLENSDIKIYRVQATTLQKQYLDAGYQKSERNYKIKYHHKEYTVICLEFQNNAQDSEPIVIIPEFLIPGRPYPVYVYLYAIDLYSGSPEKGQRWAAGETRKYFGLDTFAHTTLGRALKVFVRNIEDATKATDSTNKETSGNSEEKSKVQNASARQNAIAKKSGFPTVQATEVLRKRAAQFLHGMTTQAIKLNIMEIYCYLVRKWFEEYRRLLL